jgi:cytochrome c oxidase assembly factor CtaG
VALVSGDQHAQPEKRCPLAALDEQLLTAHMVQHLLLMIVAAPLILLGAPMITMLPGLPRRFVRDTLGPVIRRGPVHRVGAICTHPAVCWLAATVAVIGWHVPAAFDLALSRTVGMKSSIPASSAPDSCFGGR